MLRRINFYTTCIVIGLSVLLIRAGNRYDVDTYYPLSVESYRNLMKVKDDKGILVQKIPTNPYDVSPNMLLEETRSKIKFELRDYNFTYSGVNILDDLLLESGGRPLRSLIISTWRSGTTFLGDLLNSMPGNFYHYEPLLKYKVVQIKGPPHTNIALNTITKMLKCKYDDMEDYFEHGKSHLQQFSHNTRLWDHCKYKIELCLDANFTEKVCKLFPFQSMKVVRVRLQLIEKILGNDEFNARVVLLIRDPRGVMQSRQHLDFCQKGPDCSRPELLCADMISDYVAAGRFLQEYPNKLMVLRFEELALNPYSTARQLLKFLRLDAMHSVEEFLHTHTNVNENDWHSTFRETGNVPFKWKNMLNFNYVDEIQTACKTAMSFWGYRIAHNASHMTSKEFYPLDEYSFTQKMISTTDSA